MEKNRIADRTIKDIFIALLGKANANTFLENVQAQYDSGLRGKELENYARDQIKQYKMAKTGSDALISEVLGTTVNG